MSHGTAGSKRVVISGYYGCGNAGDEAVLSGIVTSFNSLARNRVELTALSQDPDATRRLHSIQSQDRMDLRTVKRQIASSDLLISGGGSLLQDITSLKSLLYYLYIMRIADAKRVPYMLYAQGIGPLNRPISRKLVSAVANRAASITVRDTGSLGLLRSIGVNRPPIEVTADPAFALTPDTHCIDQVIAEALKGSERSTSGRKMIGVSLRPWGDPANSPIDKYVRLVEKIENHTGRTCIILPMHHPDDLDFADRLNAKAQTRVPVIRERLTPVQALGIVSCLGCSVAMRLHALIFAARAAVPAFALSYDPKVTELMKLIGAEKNVADWNNFDPDDVAVRIANLVSNSVSTAVALNAYSTNLEKKALRNCEIALGLIG